MRDTEEQIYSCTSVTINAIPMHTIRPVGALQVFPAASNRGVEPNGERTLAAEVQLLQNVATAVFR